MSPRFLVWAKGCDGGIAGGKLDCGVKMTRMTVWCLWEIQVQAAPWVDENTGLDPYAGLRARQE